MIIIHYFNIYDMIINNHFKLIDHIYFMYEFLNLINYFQPQL